MQFDFAELRIVRYLISKCLICPASFVNENVTESKKHVDVTGFNVTEETLDSRAEGCRIKRFNIFHSLKHNLAGLNLKRTGMSFGIECWNDFLVGFTQNSCKRSTRHRMAAIPAPTPLRVITLCSTSPPGSPIRPWVTMRFFTILPAVGTSGLVLRRLPATSAAALTWPLGRTPSPTAQPTTTWPLVFEWGTRTPFRQPPHGSWPWSAL